MYLDALSLVEAQVGYGELGRHGHLGYEAKQVVGQGCPYPHALSTHPPARLCFDLGGRFASLCCQVALNDDVRRWIASRIADCSSKFGGIERFSDPAALLESVFRAVWRPSEDTLIATRGAICEIRARGPSEVDVPRFRGPPDRYRKPRQENLKHFARCDRRRRMSEPPFEIMSCSWPRPVV
jgi:hypothetical protein